MLPTGRTGDSRATIAALERKFADRKIDLLPHPVMAGGEINGGSAPASP